MKNLFVILSLLLILAGSAYSTDITVGSIQIQGFNPSGLPGDVTVSLSVTNGSAAVTCASPNCLQPAWVGLSGFTITISGVNYSVASVADRSNLTLTTTYAAGSATVSTIWRKYLELRIYNTGPAFQPSGESFVVQVGTVGSSAWFRRYAASVINNGSQNVLYLPEIVLPATTNATPATAKYAAGLYLVNGSLIQAYPTCISQWRLSHQTTPTSWAQICSFNVPPTAPPVDPITYYNRFEIDSRFPSCSMDKLDYFASTGNVKDCLTLGGGLLITSGVLNTAWGSSAYSTVKEEGVAITQRFNLNFIGSGIIASDNAGTLNTDVTVDSDLNALASNTTNGLWTRTGTGTGSARSLTAPAAGFSITNNDGVSGNPTFTLTNDLAGLEGLSTTGLAVRSGTDTWVTRTLQQPAAGISITNPAGIGGDPTFALANDLAAVEGLSSSGIAVRTGTDTWAVRTLQQPAAGITITNPAGTAGDPTFALANDLAAVEGISTTGLVARTAANTWSTVSGSVVFTNGEIDLATSARTGAGGANRIFRTQTPADTALSADTEAILIQFGGNSSAATVTRQWTQAAGTFTRQAEYLFVHPTYAATAATETIVDAATLWVSGAPIAGTNMTFTRSWALLITSNDRASNYFGVTSAGSPSAPIVAGNRNERFGELSGNNTVSGTDNTLFGYNTGNAISSGTGNVAMGANAGKIINTGQYNECVGESACFSLTSGSFNAGFGSSALRSVSTTSNNAGFGNSALEGTTGSNNAALGFSAGKSIGSGSNNIFLGKDAGFNGSQGNTSGSIVLGSEGFVTANNRLVIGSSNFPINEIYSGKGETNASATAYSINGTGGSGTNNAGADLEIAGGKGTGNATPGQVVVRYPLIGASGTTLQSLSSDRFPLVTNLFVATADQTVLNTTTETTLLGTGSGTKTIAAGLGQAGRVLSFRVSGIFGTTGTPSLTIRVKIGSTTILNTTKTMPNNASNLRWDLPFDITIRSGGASGTVISGAHFMLSQGTGNLGEAQMVMTGTSTIDWTSAQTLDITAQWGTGSASNTITCQQAVINIAR